MVVDGVVVYVRVGEDLSVDDVARRVAVSVLVLVGLDRQG